MAVGPRSLDPRAAHVLVVGAGGIGCPAAWALADAGVGRMTLVDPDRVEPTNLPRQVLFAPQDVGRPKAEVLAGRLARHGQAIRGLPVRLDHVTEPDLLPGVDLVLDATDGARTKDWLNAMAVRRRIPLVHAAAVGAEGRVLDVPEAGRPCLACLFGRLEAEQAGCAQLGVWNGVVGAVGFLAAATALARLSRPQEASSGYVVLDLGGGRATTLGVERERLCPVCGDGAEPRQETFPEDAGACAAPGRPSASEVSGALDLRGEVCPLNLLRARRAVEDLPAGARLAIRLGREGAESVPEGLEALGHFVLERAPEPEGGCRLLVEAGGKRGAQSLAPKHLERFARQVVLPGVGEEGQRRLLDAHVALDGSGPAYVTAAVYLAAAGVGMLTLRNEDAVGAFSGHFPFPGGVGGERTDVVLASCLDAISAGRVHADVSGAPDVVAFARGARPPGTARPWRSGAWPAGAPTFDLALSVRGEVHVVERRDPEEEVHDVPGLEGPSAAALGALLADAVQRHVVLGAAPPHAFALAQEGTIRAREGGA